MDTLLQTISSKRDAIVERGTAFADATRKRSSDLIVRVQTSTDTWRQNLLNRLSLEKIEENSVFSKFRVLVLGRVEDLIEVVGKRTREQLDRINLPDVPALAKLRELQINPTKKVIKKETKTVVKSKPKAKAKAKAKPKAKAAKPQKKVAKAAKSVRISKSVSSAKPAKATKKTKSVKKTTRRLVMPIADYDTMNVRTVLAELEGLSTAQCKTVHAYETNNKARKTVLKAIENRLSS